MLNVKTPMTLEPRVSTLETKVMTLQSNVSTINTNISNINTSLNSKATSLTCADATINLLNSASSTLSTITVNNVVRAITADRPTGFLMKTSGQTWGNQNGSFLTGWQGTDGCEIAFRNNSGKLNTIIDGVYYQNEGLYKVLDTNDDPMVACSVCYSVSGAGDKTFTGAIPFNTIGYNIGGGWDTTSKAFICPYAGIYIAVFSYYSNSSSVNQRPAIFKNNTLMVLSNGSQGYTISLILNCAAGDAISAGAQDSSFPISLYATYAHNNFSVTLIKKTI